MNDIKKPLLVARKEFADNLLTLVQHTELPLCIIEPIIKDMLQLVYQEIAKQEKAEFQSYEQQLRNSHNEEIQNEEK